MLRFSTGGNVFLHAPAATATFGRSFAFSSGKLSDQVRGAAAAAAWTIGSGPIKLFRLGKDEERACKALRPITHDGHGSAPVPFVLMVKRGGCPFLEKLVHVTQAGAIGALVVGNPPKPNLNPSDDQSQMQDIGLIRPSTDVEPELVKSLVAGSTMAYVEAQVGEAIDRIMAREGVDIRVEVLSLHEDDTTQEAKDGREVGGGEGRLREGKLALGEWEIWNLKITENPP